MAHKVTQTEWENNMCMQVLTLTKDELYMDFRYLDRALSTLIPTPKPSLRSTATDGISLFFPSEQILRLFQSNPLYLNRALLHSVFHCIFRHLWIRGKRKIPLWNLACDIAVECLLDSFDKKTVKRALSGIRVSLYRDLKEKNIPVTAGNLYQYLLPATSKDPAYFQKLQMEFFTDDHRFWPADPSASPTSIKAGQSWDQIRRRTKQEFSMRGEDNASGSELLTKQIQEGKSRRSYQDFLRKFTVLKEELHCDYDEFDLNYYSFGLRLYKNMPLIEPLESREISKISEFAIVIDTSYSTNGPLVEKFLEETFQIICERNSFFHKSQIHIIQCDNQVHSDTIVREEADIRKLLHNFTLTGGGGTDFRPAFSYINRLLEKNVFHDLRGVLYFTDGKGIFPSKKPPYETAFLFLEENESAQVPAWAMKLTLHEEDFIS
ncbi:MAG: VWA-like domain-containing protein [Eubacterium sp.]|nr:VWA-like domain-containing protein [Eubacterium sp.]MDD7209151.1 VWA-like domain-containing protein [Lachnospiraceae bacterium]